MAFDILILNGTIVDGTNSPRYKADVGISNGRIEAIGALADAEASHAHQELGQVGGQERPGGIQERRQQGLDGSSLRQDQYGDQ